MLSQNVNNKKCAPKFVFFNEKKSERNPTIFDFESTFINFENWVNGEVSKFDFQSQFSRSKIIRIFLIFFSLKNMNLGAHFLLLTFFDNINF